MTCLRSARPATSRRRRWIVVGIIIAIIVIASLRTFAIFYTDALWFSSVDLHSVWVKLFEIKVGLMVVFAGVFAILLLASLLVAERLAPKGPSLDAEDEFVKRYQEIIGPYSRWLRAGVVVVLSLIVGSQAIGQWNNWILFRNSTAFNATDPQFHRNVGYFVFTLPFEQFLVHWTLVALVVVLLVTVLTHYLNGGIRLQGPRPRVRPAVKAHISVILGLLALVKAVGYYLARFTLDLSSNGYNQGADYTDVHARLPALELLILVSLAAAILLIYNIRRQGWALPILGVGLWFLVALTAGTIYPAAVQALKVNPAQNTLERPYIQRNIDATRAAYGLKQTPEYQLRGLVQPHRHPAVGQQRHLGQCAALGPDPDPAHLRQAAGHSYLLPVQHPGRRPVQGQRRRRPRGRRRARGQRRRPALDLVGQHHAAVHPRLRDDHLAGQHHAPSNGDPHFGVGDVPPTSNSGLPKVTQPSVYFGLNNSGYVVANTKQPEIDFQLTNGTNVETHYKGNGGVQLSNFFDQAMFAIRFSDLNLIISNQITSESRLMFDRGVQARVTKAAPFLSLDADPYPVLLNGHIDWIQDAYTTSDNYPYAQNADTSALPAGSGLNQNLNYVRNSVKVVIDAYTGKMTFYVMDPKDPIIQTYEKAFPGMFTPASKMSAALRAHLRYPEDIFTLQATMYGKYHITNAQSFYSAADAWTLSPSPGSGSPAQALQTTLTTNAQGQTVSTGQLVRMAPIYQELQVPGQSQQSFSLLDAFVPVSGQSQIQTLSGFMIAGNDPGPLRQTPDVRHAPGQPGQRPGHRGLPDRRQPRRSPRPISLLNQNGSSALLGNVLMIPVANSLALHPAALRGVVAEPLPGAPAGHRRLPEPGGHRHDALRRALRQVFSAPISYPDRHTGATGSLSPQVRSLLNAAQQPMRSPRPTSRPATWAPTRRTSKRWSPNLHEVQQLTGGTVGATGSTTTTTTAP